jgi:hypothetical protein
MEFACSGFTDQKIAGTNEQGVRKMDNPAL